MVFLLALNGCTTTPSIQLVKVPVLVRSNIEDLPDYIPETSKLTENDKDNFNKVITAVNIDLKVYKKRDEIYSKKIKEHNLDVLDEKTK